MAPDISADTGLGCLGMGARQPHVHRDRPGLRREPGQGEDEREGADRGRDAAAPARIAANDSPPACAPIRTSASRIAAAPACVITAYHWAASRASARRCPVSSSSSDDSAISSQAAMNVAMLAAAGTASRLVMNSGSSAAAVRPPPPPCAA